MASGPVPAQKREIETPFGIGSRLRPYNPCPNSFYPLLAAAPRHTPNIPVSLSAASDQSTCVICAIADAPHCASLLNMSISDRALLRCRHSINQWTRSKVWITLRQEPMRRSYARFQRSWIRIRSIKIGNPPFQRLLGSRSYIRSVRARARPFKIVDN